MKKIISAEDLREAIFQLQNKQAMEWPELKDQFLSTCHNLKPANLIRNTFRDLTSAGDFKTDMIDTTLGLTAGYLSKKVVMGASRNPVKQLLGGLLQVGVANFVSKNNRGIRSVACYLIQNILRKDKEQDIESIG